VQPGVAKLSCNKTALKRCTSTETLWNRKAPSLSSPEDEEIFLPKLPKSWHVIIINTQYVGHKDDESQAQMMTTMMMVMMMQRGIAAPSRTTRTSRR